jgi:hypothetical protein
MNDGDFVKGRIIRSPFLFWGHFHGEQAFDGAVSILFRRARSLVEAIA